MKKLTLDLDALTVDTFEPEARRLVSRGTVEANENTLQGQATCTSCQDTTRVGACFCTECVSCFDCTAA